MIWTVVMRDRTRFVLSLEQTVLIGFWILQPPPRGSGRWNYSDIDCCYVYGRRGWYTCADYEVMHSRAFAGDIVFR